MARRRPLTGTPLLLASSAGIALAGCGPSSHRPPVGNLMAPEPSVVQVCVDVQPTDAQAVVRVNGDVATDRCTTVELPYGNNVEVTATTSYGTVTRWVSAEQAREPVVIDMMEALLPPTGNLMAPQPQ